MNGTVLERRYSAEIGYQDEPSTATATRRHRPLSTTLMISGALVVVSAALVALIVPTGGSSAKASAGGAATAPAPAPAAEAAPAPSFPDVGTADVSYDPGHSSGWHTHPGVHSVVVLSGTLTIYDAGCVRQDYGPGQAYLGGGEAHLARNETPEPLNAVVTYVYEKTTTADHGSIVLPPAGCTAS